MIAVQRPWAFLFLFILLPVVFYTLMKFKKVTASLGGLYVSGKVSDSLAFKRVKFSVVLRILFGCLSFVSAVFAFAGISIGFSRVPVQKSGDAVSFVFDISYSMTAEDAPGGLSRLEAAGKYSEGLLSRMKGSSVSVVIAKGDGVLAVPLTEDFAGIESFIENLSPSLMTSSGSSIGGGILCALKSFPANISSRSHIWVFTDGDETDGTLSQSLDDAVRYGIPVTLVGFGTSVPVEITAGDGKTKVMTSLNVERMIDAAAASNKRAFMPGSQTHNNSGLISYLAADSEGSAFVLLDQLGGAKNTNLQDGESSAENTAYENQPVSRHGVFIAFAVIFLILSYVFSEFRRSDITAVLFTFVCPFMFMSCSDEMHGILSGTFSWYEEKYQQAAADFLRVYTSAEADGNKTVSAYAAYDLASTYIMQEEYEAALSRLEQVPPDATADLKSAALYNMGIISVRNGDYDEAALCFRQAILLDPENINAKINLELCNAELKTRRNQSGEAEMQPVSEDNDDSALERAVFNLIRQEEREQWQKLQSDKTESSSLDY